MNPSEESPPALIPPGPKLTFKAKGPEVPPPVERHLEPDPRETRKQRKRRIRRAKPTKAGSAFLQSFAGFLMILVLLGGLLFHRVAGMDFLPENVTQFLRIALVAGFWLVLMIEAFTEDMMQGLFIVFFPPYAFVYGLLFADFGPLRGITVGLLLFLGAEVYFDPGDALVIHANNWVTGLVDKGQRAIIDDPRQIQRY